MTEPKKTYKREVAAGIATFVGLLFGVSVWDDPSVAGDHARFLTPFAVTCLMAAFYADYRAKQEPRQ